jgi:hypothetical protein
MLRQVQLETVLFEQPGPAQSNFSSLSKNFGSWFRARKKSFHIEQTQGSGCYTTKRKSGRLNGTTGHFQPAVTETCNAVVGFQKAA